MTYSLPTFETTSHFHQQGDRHKSCLALCVYKLLCNCRYEWNLLNFCVNSLTPRLSGTVFLEIHNYGVFYLFISLHQIQNHIHNKKFIKAARPLHEAYKSHSNPIKVINQWMFRTSSFLVVRAIGDTCSRWFSGVATWRCMSLKSITLDWQTDEGKYNTCPFLLCNCKARDKYTRVLWVPSPPPNF